ncbi:uncharacterized protein LOC141598548 isoform X2 [Silene latifolia]|uniref:uncharacterized protein LOC141598548 isoform X2 n=1 Tax=Silene latifolia TaxID=37657 RepID=UPI003D76C3FA
MRAAALRLAQLLSPYRLQTHTLTTYQSYNSTPSLLRSTPSSTTTSPLLRRRTPISSYLRTLISLIRVSAMSTTSDDNGSSDDDVSADQLVDFVLSPTCSLKLQKGDITLWSVDGSSDAIVNAANERMLGGGGVDGAIHRAAGPELKEACYEVPQVLPGVRCPVGEARITPGFRLPASHVIHTVGPIYDEDENPEALLESAYRNTLTLAKENNIQYVAFPAISCGIYGYPFDEAANIAISTIKEFSNDFKEISMVLSDANLTNRF